MRICIDGHHRSWKFVMLIEFGSNSWQECNLLTLQHLHQASLHPQVTGAYDLKLYKLCTTT